MSPIAPRQISLPFEPGLLDLWPTSREYLLYQIQLLRLSQKAIAADMDISPSVLSRKLNQGKDDCQRLSLDDLEGIFKHAGAALVRSMMIYFATKYCDSQEEVEKREQAEIAALAERLNTLLARRQDREKL